jgi:hypothetical protein
VTANPSLHPTAHGWLRQPPPAGELQAEAITHTVGSVNMDQRAKAGVSRRPDRSGADDPVHAETSPLALVRLTVAKRAASARLRATFKDGWRPCREFTVH